jgi:hypothetical protein
MGNRKVRDRLGDLDVNRRIILEWILKKQNEKVWTAFIQCRRTNSMLL